MTAAGRTRNRVALRQAQGERIFSQPSRDSPEEALGHDMGATLRIAAAVIATMLIFPLGQTAGQSSPSEPVTSVTSITSIRPGAGVGVLNLGMSEADAIRAIGEPTGRSDDPVAHLWWDLSHEPAVSGSPSRLFALLSVERTIAELQVLGSKMLRTPAGNAIGASIQNFIAEFGRESREASRIADYRYLAFDAHGIAVNVDGASVIRIYVRPKRTTRGTPDKLGTDIVPGRGIGGIMIGMSLDEVRTRLGQPDETSSGTTQAQTWWLLHGRFKGFENQLPLLTVFSSAEGRVTSMTLTADGVKTPRGNQVGMSGEAFSSEFGQASMFVVGMLARGVTTMFYGPSGFSYSFVTPASGTKIVIAVSVYRPQ